MASNATDGNSTESNSTDAGSNSTDSDALNEDALDLQKLPEPQITPQHIAAFAPFPLPDASRVYTQGPCASCVGLVQRVAAKAAARKPDGYGVVLLGQAQCQQSSLGPVLGLQVGRLAQLCA